MFFKEGDGLRLALFFDGKGALRQPAHRCAFLVGYQHIDQHGATVHL
jgi:hypothetical protein